MRTVFTAGVVLAAIATLKGASSRKTARPWRLEWLDPKPGPGVSHSCD